MSDIKFETINGQLCRMVEPTPLTPEATFPRVAQFNASDHRTINLRNRKPFILRDINNEGYVHYELAYAAHYSLFEIIGYPVVEGSKEWALWQMTQGKAITFFDQPSRVLKLVNGYVQDSINGGYWDRKSGNEFLSYASSTGWQIYTEPEPEFNVGNWVETNKQHHVEITEFPAKHYNIESKVYECYNLSSNKRHLIEEREIVRKLSPSEVVVDFGSFRGTIVGCGDIEPIVKVFNGVDWIATVLVSALDENTRERVKDLLKAQEDQ